MSEESKIVNESTQDEEEKKESIKTIIGLIEAQERLNNLLTQPMKETLAEYLYECKYIGNGEQEEDEDDH